MSLLWKRQEFYRGARYIRLHYFFFHAVEIMDSYTSIYLCTYTYIHINT